MNTTRQVVYFLILTWFLSWPIWILSGVLARGSSMIYDLRWLAAQAGVFAPSISALIVSCFHSRALRKNTLRLLLLYVFILAMGIPIAIHAPSSVKEFTPWTSAVVVFMALVSLLYFSPWNHLLLNPASGERQQRGNTRWIFLATFGMPVIFFLAWLLASAGGAGRSISALDGGFSGLTVTLILGFCMDLNYGGSMGEELGWRGFCLPLLLRNHDPLRSSLILGIIWALWHLPVDLSMSGVPGFYAVFGRIVWTLPLTIIFTWLYLSAPANLLTAVLLHTSINILPAIGFSHYERSMLLCTLVVIVLAILAARTPVMKSWKPS